MDSDPNVQDYESRAKRLKLEFEDPDIGGLCDNLGFPRFSHAATASIDSGEGQAEEYLGGEEGLYWVNSSAGTSRKTQNARIPALWRN
ncbi:hypothetical protein YQE_03808, partial [Dendroctonus ponderosae]